MSEIKEKVNAIKLRMHEIDKQHARDINEQQRAIRDLQKICKHNDNSYQMGTGNNDSYYKCNDCGWEW